MTTRNLVTSRYEIEGLVLPDFSSESWGDRAMTEKERDALAVTRLFTPSKGLNRRLLIFYWTNEEERTRRAKRSRILDLSMYVYATAIILWSAAANNLAVLMFGTIGFACYVVLSHVYEERPRARQKIADGNYLNLMYPSIERN